MKRTISLLAPLALVALVGCGGSNTPTASTPAPAPATGYTYTDPTASATDWKLVKDASSTATKLVLNLVGPTDGTKYRGVGFTLQTDPTLIKIAKFKDATGNPLGYLKDSGVFTDRVVTDSTVYPNLYGDAPASLQAGGVRDGKLMIGIFQKNDDSFRSKLTGWEESGATAKDCNVPVLQVTFEFDASLKALPGNVPLTVLKARVIPDVVFEGVKDSYIWDVRTRHGVNVLLKVGTLTLK